MSQAVSISRGCGAGDGKSPAPDRTDRRDGRIKALAEGLAQHSAPQGRQDSNLQPPVLETSGLWRGYAVFRDARHSPRHGSSSSRSANVSTRVRCSLTPKRRVFGESRAARRFSGDLLESGQPPPPRVCAPQRTPPPAENDIESGNVTRSGLATRAARTRRERIACESLEAPAKRRERPSK